MAILSQKFHDIKTKLHAVLTYRTGKCSVYHVCLKYHISKASLMRWNRAYDGTKESLMEKVGDLTRRIPIVIRILK